MAEHPENTATQDTAALDTAAQEAGAQDTAAQETGATPVEGGRPGRTADPSLSPTQMLRWFWTQLTSMRTALVLLFLLALAAIPGSLVPQKGVSPIRVQDFRAEHPRLDRVYSALQLYDVYTSPWFSAIYLLLLVSLIGCIIPRIGVYARAVRSAPPRVPARLTRLPEWGSTRLADDASHDDALAEATRTLRSRRFRVVSSSGTDRQGDWRGLSAERGYLRELGNLVFHTSLVVMLAAIAWNSLLSYKGSAIVIEGRGFSNVITQYDEFQAGPLVDSDRLPPFSLRVKRFFAEFEKGPVQRGAARLFRADVTVTEQGRTRDTSIEVNKPVDVAGTRVHVLGHGYAAHVTVRDGNQKVAYSGPVVFVPQDGNFTSYGVIKAPDGRPRRLAFEGWFLPTGTVDQQGPRSVFPDALSPELFLNVWTGPPKRETGRPENVFVLDKTGLTQMKRNGTPVALRLKPKQVYELPDGQGSISFDGWSRWTKLQISRSPGLPLAFGALAVGVAGLCLSLFVRPRRLWLRLRSDGRVEAGGLDRADSRTGLADDVAAILGSVAPAEPPPPTASSDDVAPEDRVDEGEER